MGYNRLRIDKQEETSSMSVVQNVICHCRTQVKIKKINYVWSIDNFWSIADKIVNVLSKEVIDSFQFCICINNEKDTLKLNAVTNYSNTLNVSYSIFIKIDETDEEHLISGSDILNQYEFKLLYTINISMLKNNPEKYIPNNTLTLRFDCNIFQDTLNDVLLYSHKPKELINMDVRKFIPENFQHVTFVVENNKIFTNKILLCSQSKIFQDMLCKENYEVHINDVSYDVFRYLLFFISTGYLPEEIKKNVTILCDLFIAADKYDIRNLKLMCEQNIINNMTIRNVVSILEITHLYNGNILKKYTKDFIKLYFEDIVNTANFAILIKNFPDLILEIQNAKIPGDDDNSVK